MNHRSESGKVFGIFLCALLLALVLHSLPKRLRDGISSLVRDGLYAPFVWVDWQYRVLRNNLARELRLERELARARLELQRLREAKLENERLRRMLRFREAFDYDLIVAEVVGTGTARYPSAVVVARGAADGVKPSMPALTPQGVVGKVASVGKHTAVVQLITDPATKLAAIDQRSRISGIVEAEPGGMLVMSRVPKGEDVAVGDRIVTSGYGGIFPKGLLIGHVVSVSDPPEGIFKRIELEPAAKLGRLEEVFLLVGAPSAADSERAR